MDPRARTPSSTAADRVYVDVQPQYGWVTGDKEDTLVVDLTGTTTTPSSIDEP